MRVLFTFKPNERLEALFEQNLGDTCQLLFPDDPTPEALSTAIDGAEVVVGWLATADMLDRAASVRLWQYPGVGVAHLADLFQKHPHITLANCHGNTYFTAQHAVALLLTLMNKVNLHHDWMVQGRWRTGDEEAKSVPLRNRRVGILGYGHIGRKAARFLSGFDISLAAYKNKPRATDTEVPGVRCFFAEEGDSLEAFAEKSDILIITLPLTPRTEGLIGEPQLRTLGPEGLLVNVGRGPIVVEDDLYHALRDGTIAGAALDVWWAEKEPIESPGGEVRPFTQPFHVLPNVVMSPHRAASPFDDLARWEDVVENIRRAACGRDDFLNTVDLLRGY